MPNGLNLYLQQVKATKKLLNSLGVDVLTEKFIIKPMFVILLCHVIFYQFIQIHSIYHFRDDFVNVSFSLVTWFYGFQVIHKFN